MKATVHACAALSAVAAIALLSGCAPLSPNYTQDALADAVKVPAGHRVALHTVGVGQITYECRAKKDAPGQFEWAFAGPDAALNDRSGTRVGKYYGPPATWESVDGSKVTATQLAVSPAGAGNIPHQLVKANPASGSGVMSGVTYIQRVATIGGVAPASVCGAANPGSRQTVGYQADYIFWKAA
ncbi:DUF3455 domain-containing protein [Janthinobacterium agaricidamnosum]|uniref:DUF3455 domain-containing protein n=1 Tax=Janthinobacterium agaricidamnosum TaxID=55508 RepID=UPI00056EB77D|nr:DUF3455 domain-containing protein [Janthinobacterium agaricidamnosum]